MAEDQRNPLGAAMTGLALFRIGLGAASWVSPRALARAFGLPAERSTPELEYMTRVFGVRAVALGVGYLASSGDARRLWHRLWLLCDAADTVMGVGMIGSRQLEPKLGAAALATTAPATVIDVAALAAEAT